MEADYLYVSILLHTLPDELGWEIFGIKHDYTRELLLPIPPDVEMETVEFLAFHYAENLALWPEPDID